MYNVHLYTIILIKENTKCDKFQITEKYTAKADIHRCFFGCIEMLNDNDGNSFVFSRIVVNDGFIWAKAVDQKELGNNLDEMAIMIIGYGTAFTYWSND